MSSMPSGRHKCGHPGCEKSYLRSEHLNRHRLTHKQRAFACYFCKKPFTRNDLLQVHLRRHQTRSFEKVEMQRDVTPPHEGHRNALLIRTNPHSTALDKHTHRQLESSGNSPFANAQQPVDASAAGLVDIDNIRQPDTPFSPLPLDLLHQQLSSEREVSRQLDFPWLFQHTGLFDPFGGDNSQVPRNPQLGGEPMVSEDSPRSSHGKEPWISHTDYQKLLADFPELEAMNLGDSVSLLQLFDCGLDYLDICMPSFHRPTLKISSLSPLVILAVCSLGAFLSTIPGAKYTGKLLYKHVWRRTYTNVMEGPQVDVSILQAMEDKFGIDRLRVVIEHVGYYTSMRHDHQMADIMHSVIVTLSRRSNLLDQSFNEFRNHQESLESQWKNWANQETLIRLAYNIFIYDISYSIYFMHSSLLSAGMLKLPLPCSQALWQAKTANEWEKEIARSRETLVQQSVSSMQASMRFLLATQTDDLSPSQQALQDDFSSNPFTMQILIHGIASAILDHNRALHSASSQLTHSLKLEDFRVALARWHDCFKKMESYNRVSEISVSALITYHFANILLHENLSTIMVAAGAAYAEGCAVTSQRAQESFVPLITTKPVTKEAFTHALEIIRLCLEDRYDSSLVGKSPVPAVPRQRRPLYLDYTAFIAVLVLWAHVLSAQNMLWMQPHGGRTDDGDSISPETEMTSHSRSGGINTGSTARSYVNENVLVVMQLLERKQQRDSIDAQELEATKQDVHRLMHVIRDALASVSWEIAQEASQILESLVERNNFT